MELVLVGIGGGVGAIARYGLSSAVVERFGGAFPAGTFAVNLIGALLIGIVATVLTDRSSIDAHLRLLLVTGFLGGFTTFSAYTLELIRLIDAGTWGIALLYALGSNALCLLACVAGIALVRALT